MPGENLSIDAAWFVMRTDKRRISLVGRGLISGVRVSVSQQ